MSKAEAETSIASRALLDAWTDAGGNEMTYRALSPIQLNEYELFKLPAIFPGGETSLAPATKRCLTKAKALIGDQRFSEIVADEASRRQEGKFSPNKSGEAFIGLLVKLITENTDRPVIVRRQLLEREEAKLQRAEAKAKETRTTAEILNAEMPLEANTAGKKARVSKKRLLSALVVEQDPDAIAAENLLWASPAFVQTTLPHRDPKADFFFRTNGVRYLDLVSARSNGIPLGLPFGPRPRLLLHYIAGRIQASASREIELPNSLYALHKELGLTNGTQNYSNSADQARRLFNAFISIGEVNPMIAAKGIERYHCVQKNIVFAEEIQLGWEINDKQQTLFGNRIKLSEFMFSVFKDNVFPVRKLAMNAIQQSSFAIDIYVWLCWRNYILHVKGQPQVSIPFTSRNGSVGLMQQFGSDYDENNVRFFIRQFMREMDKVKSVWHGKLNIAIEGQTFILKQSDPQVEKPAKLSLGKGITPPLIGGAR